MYTTVFNIDNNHKCFLSIINQETLLITE